MGCSRSSSCRAQLSSDVQMNPKMNIALRRNVMLSYPSYFHWCKIVTFTRAYETVAENGAFGLFSKPTHAPGRFNPPFSIRLKLRSYHGAKTKLNYLARMQRSVVPVFLSGAPVLFETPYFAAPMSSYALIDTLSQSCRDNMDDAVRF